MRRSDFRYLFSVRPTSATVGLSIAAFSFGATILQAIYAFVSNRNFVFFDFITGAGPSNGMTKQQALVGFFWSVLGIIACYRALQPRQIARFSVLACCGIKLMAYLAFSEIINLPMWQYIFTLVVAILPIIFLLTRESNLFYGRNQ